MKYYKKLDYLIAGQKYFAIQRKATKNATRVRPEDELTETLGLLQNRSKLIDN